MISLADEFNQLHAWKESALARAGKDPVELRWVEIEATGYQKQLETLQKKGNKVHAEILLEHVERGATHIKGHQQCLQTLDPTGGYLDVLESHPTAAYWLAETSPKATPKFPFYRNPDEPPDLKIYPFLFVQGKHPDPDFAVSMLKVLQITPLQAFSASLHSKPSDLLQLLQAKDTTYQLALTSAIAGLGANSVLAKALDLTGVAMVDKVRAFFKEVEINAVPGTTMDLGITSLGIANHMAQASIPRGLVSLESCTHAHTNDWGRALSAGKTNITGAQALRASVRILKVHREQSQELTEDVQNVVVSLILQALEEKTPGRDILLHHALAGKNKPLYKYLLEQKCNPNFNYTNSGFSVPLSAEIMETVVAQNDPEWLTLAIDHGLQETETALWKIAIHKTMAKHPPKPIMRQMFEQVSRISQLPGVGEFMSYGENYAKEHGWGSFRGKELLSVVAPHLNKPQELKINPAAVMEIVELDLV